MMKTFAAIITGVTTLLFLSAPCPVRADDTYVPPPMFEDSLPPMVRPEAPAGNLVEPRVSPREPIVSTPPAEQATPPAPTLMKPILERKSLARQATAKETKKEKAPVPPKKPVAPTVKTPTAAAVVETPVPTPISPAQPQAMPQPAPIIPVPDKPAAAKPDVPHASKVTSKGVVTGPVTMPAVPTQNVEAQQVFADSMTAEPTQTIMERTQQQAEKEKKIQAEMDEAVAESKLPKDKPETIEPSAPPADNTKPMEFDSTKQDVLKKILPYQPGQIDLSAADLLVIGSGLKAELAKKEHWRIQIRSFATPQGTGVSSDRRIALSRAIALRKSLVDQGVRASRIDVRAEGLQTDSSQSGDRVDVYLYSPIEKIEEF